MSKHIKKAFQADPFGWTVGITIVLAVAFMLSTCSNLDKREELEPIDAVPVSE